MNTSRPNGRLFLWLRNPVLQRGFLKLCFKKNLKLISHVKKLTLVNVFLPNLLIKALHILLNAATDPITLVIKLKLPQAKLLKKCVDCSDPLQALRLAETLGVKVEKGLKAAGIEAPEGYVPGEALEGSMAVD